MTEQPQREQIVGQQLVGIAHSQYSEPEFIVQGIGPASFRSHYLTFGNGVSIFLFTADVHICAVPADVMPAETTGIQPADLIGRSVTAVVADDVGAPIVVLEGGIYLIDANDAFYGNPLEAGHFNEFERLRGYYADNEHSSFFDYWSGEPVSREFLQGKTEKEGYISSEE